MRQVMYCNLHVTELFCYATALRANALFLRIVHHKCMSTILNIAFLVNLGKLLAMKLK